MAGSFLLCGGLKAAHQDPPLSISGHQLLHQAVLPSNLNRELSQRPIDSTTSFHVCVHYVAEADDFVRDFVISTS